MTAHDDLAEDEAIIAGATAAGIWSRIKPLFGKWWMIGKIINHEAIPMEREEDLIYMERACGRYPALVAEVRELRQQIDSLLGLTALLAEHPPEYEGPCLCKMCQSYA